MLLILECKRSALLCLSYILNEIVMNLSINIFFNSNVAYIAISPNTSCVFQSQGRGFDVWESVNLIKCVP